MKLDNALQTLNFNYKPFTKAKPTKVPVPYKPITKSNLQDSNRKLGHFRGVKAKKEYNRWSLQHTSKKVCTPYTHSLEEIMQQYTPNRLEKYI